MVILHIAKYYGTNYQGVDVAISLILKNQSKIENVAFLNLDNKTIDGINCFMYFKNKTISSLPMPYCKPDIIVFHELYRPQYLLLYREAVKNNIPYVIIPHGGLTKKAQSIKLVKKKVANFLLFNKYFNNARYIQFLSQNEANQSTINNKYFIGTNGIESVENIIKKDKIKKIVYIGRLDIYIKGIDLMLNAIAIVKKSLVENNCFIELYGPNENNAHRTINEMIIKNKLNDIVSVKNGVFGFEKGNILKKSDCFIQTSRSEGMSMGILEALEYGLPCILTRGTSMIEYINEYKAGWICENNVNSIANAILDAINYSGNVDEISNNAKRLIKDNFSIEKITSDIIAKYQEIVAGE